MPDVNPLNFKIKLLPDFNSFHFFGKTEITLEAEKPVNEIMLNILDIAVWKCRVKNGDRYDGCAFRVSSRKEEMYAVLPEPMAGTIVLRLEYQGRINNLMAGFYRSTYMANGEKKNIAVTQFQESDARRAFPCIDHPAAKATFDIEIECDSHLTVISNSAVKAETLMDKGKKRVTFEQTPRMSTYLVFFSIGEFELVEDKIDSRVRVATLPGMREYGTYGMDFGRKSLAFSEDYYGIPYPLPKMDLIAIPDFAFGAMENWGAITFRENLLLHYPNVTSKSGEKRICEVIAHEIAHQWFGNLVTPSDWKYLWLNESFATLFGYGVVAHYYPEWEVWEQFIHDMTSSAMSRDSLHETYAIEIPAGDHVIINLSTAPIIYNKGGSILRQIQGYIGHESFRKGLRYYLEKHAYANAASHHLWEAFEHVSDKPINALMKSWVEQPGYPVIDVDREGENLKLTQKRFTCLPNDFNQNWLIPVSIEFFSSSGSSETITLLMDGPETTVKTVTGTVAYKLNSRQMGFFRVRYKNRENLEELGRRITDKTLCHEDRWGLQNDLFNHVKSGDASFRDYLDYLEYFKYEDNFLPLISIAENLSAAYHILDDQHKEIIRAFAMSWYETILLRIGYEPAPDESQTTSILREQLVWDAVRYGSEKIVDKVLEKFSVLINGGSIHPDLMKSAMQVGAWMGDEKTFEWFVQRYRESEIEHERTNILTALGCFKGPSQIELLHQFVLESVPPRNQHIPVAAMVRNPFAVPFQWNWYIEYLNEIEQFHPMIYERVIAAIIPTAGMERPDEVTAFFTDYMKKNDKAADVIKLSLERMEINLRMRQNNGCQNNG